VKKEYETRRMSNQQRKDRALEALTKYRGEIRSEERIASFAARFVEQERRWNDVRKEPSTDTMLVLLKDSKTNVVSLGYRTTGEGGQIQAEPKGFVRLLWVRIL
jgi:hypothetical protein